jgi:flavin-dependent dehydrogenase
LDAAVAVFAYHRTPTTIEPIALVESAPSGWWYSAPLPDGQVVAALVTDAALLRRGAVRWVEELRLAPHTRERIGGAVLAGPLRTVSATCSKLDCVWGDEWIAVGDAAMAGDPLAGDGVHRALQEGARAGYAILASARQPSRCDYCRGVEAAFEAHRRRRAAYYERETRWPDTLFWRRR